MMPSIFYLVKYDIPQHLGITLLQVDRLNSTHSKNNNKYYYALHRLFIQLLCYSSTSDIASGKALLATWLHKQGRFEDSLKVIDFTLEQKHNRRYHCGFDRAFLCQSSLPELTNVDFEVS
jgi:hypothetical protein